MVMSDKRVLQAMDEGRIVIEPFAHGRLSTSSYDVRLGEWFYREQSPHLSADLFNILDPEHVARVWGDPEHAPVASEVLPDAGRGHFGLSPEDRVILLKPGETILAHTEEFIGGRRDITTMMKARSSLGRSFILVCKCAGWGDVGYVNRWTMEITNVSRHYSIPLPVGCRVAQIVFMETGAIEGADYVETGAYQGTADLAALRERWRPSDMLPRIRA